MIQSFFSRSQRSQNKPSRLFSIKSCRRSSLWGLGVTLAIALPTAAAETVYGTFAGFELEVAITELQTYAKGGKEPDLIRDYGALLTPEQLQQLRESLSREVTFPAPVIARFLSTPSGYRFLESITDIVKARSPEVDSVLALRTSLILAASSEDNLTVLSLLKTFPDQGVEIDFDSGLQLFQAFTKAMEEHERNIDQIKQSTDTQKSLSAFSIAPYQQQGSFLWEKISLQLTDNRPVRLKHSGQVRAFPAEIYLPQQANITPKPIIILSHGLGSGVTAFKYLAEHLASHGYVVAVPEHPGSSINHWRALLENESDQIARPQEFVDRPLDIQYLLDALTAKNIDHPQLRGQLNLEQVGLFGHSYGGYTALAIAGADIDFSQLEANCSRDILRAFNPSLLLQCQAKGLSSAPIPALKDDRVKAIFINHPIISSVLGDQGLAPIQIPVAMVSGGLDFIAPLSKEQLPLYQQLQASNQYLLLLEQADHFSSIDQLGPDEELFQQPEVTSEEINIQARQAMKALGLGFFQQVLTPSPSSQTPFLALTHQLNQTTFPIYSLKR